MLVVVGVLAVVCARSGGVLVAMGALVVGGVRSGKYAHESTVEGAKRQW